MASLRISIAGVVLLPFFWREINKVPRKDLGWLLVVGLAGSAIPAFSYGFAQTHISSAVAGMLNSLTPLFTLVIGMIFFSLQVQSRNFLGVAIGLLGAVFLITQAIQGSLSTNAAYASLIILGTICYATSGNVVAKFLPHINSFTISIISYVLLLPLGLTFLFSSDFTHRLTTDDKIYYSLAAVTALAILGTALASIIYFSLVKRTSPLFASMVTYLIPVIATILGVFDGEPFSVYHITGLVMIISGVYLSR